MDAATLIASVSAIVGVVGLIGAWMKFRESAFRRGDVLAWSDEVIASLQSLLLICILKEPQLNAEAAKSKLTEIIFATSTLVERGRMFFKNKIIDDHGKEKEAAYRGYRPKILDPIVVAHQIACGWHAADAETRLRMQLVAEDSLKIFVSLVQKEVGRDKTASAETRVGGSGANLSYLLRKVDGQRVDHLRRL